MLKSRAMLSPENISWENKGPVRISPELRNQCLDMARWAAIDGRSTLRQCMRTIAPNAPSDFWKLFGRSDRTSVVFVDNRLGPEVKYPLALKRLQAGKATVASPAATAWDEFTGQEAHLTLSIHTRDRYFPDSKQPRSRFTLKERIRLAESIPHEFGHFISHILYDCLMRAGNIIPYWSYRWVVPVMLEEGWADIQALCEPTSFHTNTRGRSIVFQPGLEMMLKYLQHSPSFGTETTLGQEVFDNNQIPSPRLKMETLSYLWFNRAKRFLAYLSILGIRCGFSPHQLLELLLSSPKLEYDSINRLPIAGIASQLNEHEVRYPYVLREKAIETLCATLVFYALHYDELAWAGHAISQNKASNNKSETPEAVALSISLNAKLFTDLAGGVSLFGGYCNQLLALIRTSEPLRRQAKLLTHTTPIRAEPVSIYSREGENPFLEAYNWRHNYT